MSGRFRTGIETCLTGQVHKLVRLGNNTKVENVTLGCFNA